MGSADYLTTREVAEMLRVKERKIYEMASNGDIPVSRITGKLLFPRRIIERWLHDDTAWPSRAAGRSAPATIFAGSHDPLLEWALRASNCGIPSYFDGSSDGVERLGRRDAMAAGLHLPAVDGDDLNIDAIRQSLPGAPVVLVQWARRQQGLVVRREDERRFQRLSILRGQRVVRRQDGAGSRLLLDRLLKDAGVATNEVIWTPTPAHSETEVAILVASGEAEAGLAVQSTARQMNLGFIPLATERFDIAVWRSSFFGASFQTLWRFCTGESFKARAATLGGYDLSEFGVVQFNGP